MVIKTNDTPFTFPARILSKSVQYLCMCTGLKFMLTCNVLTSGADGGYRLQSFGGCITSRDGIAFLEVHNTLRRAYFGLNFVQKLY